jgi:hypothetical protein
MESIYIEYICLISACEPVFVQQIPLEYGSQVWGNGMEAANAAELNLMLAGKAVPSRAPGYRSARTHETASGPA